MNSVFNPIRTASNDDIEKIEAAAARFASRHGIEVGDDDSAQEAVQIEVGYRKDCHNDRRLSDLWDRCFARAVGEKPSAGLDIAWGNIGYWVSQ